MGERLLPVGLVLCSVLYTVAIHQRAKVAGHRIEFDRAVAFLSGVGALALAVVGPLDGASGRALSWHMTQHLLLISVAAPLLAIGHPLQLILELFAPRFGGRRRSPPGGFGATALLAAAALAVLFVWHIPALYQDALRSDSVHAAEHLSLLGSSMLLWTHLIGRAQLGASVVGVFLITLPMTAFGVGMTMSRTPWYSDYVGRSAVRALHDQQLAGVVMWSFGGLAALIAAVAIFAVWLMRGSATLSDRSGESFVNEAARS